MCTVDYNIFNCLIPRLLLKAFQRGAVKEQVHSLTLAALKEQKQFGPAFTHTLRFVTVLEGSEIM